MPLLEQRRSEVRLDDTLATDLILFVLRRPWPDYWVSRALHWVDDGVWSEDFEELLRAISQDKAFSQETRHRAWRHAKPRPQS